MHTCTAKIGDLEIIVDDVDYVEAEGQFLWTIHMKNSKQPYRVRSANLPLELILLLREKFAEPNDGDQLPSQLLYTALRHLVSVTSRPRELWSEVVWLAGSKRSLAGAYLDGQLGLRGYQQYGIAAFDATEWGDRARAIDLLAKGNLQAAVEQLGVTGKPEALSDLQDRVNIDRFGNLRDFRRQVAALAWDLSEIEL